MELIAERSLEGLSDPVSMLIGQAMRLERERHLTVAPYERNPQRAGYANGTKPKTVKPRIGALGLAVPKIYESGFYSALLERGLRSECALELALGEMYVSGISTRKVTRVTAQLYGFEISSTEVLRCAAALDEQLSAWRERPLGPTPTRCWMRATRRCAMAVQSSIVRCYWRKTIYRIIYEVADAVLVVTVIQVGHRKHIYKRG